MRVVTLKKYYLHVFTGSFLLIDGKDYKVKGTWGKAKVEFGYDFWYQPRHNVMISTAWGEPAAWSKGFDPQDVLAGNVIGPSFHYGRLKPFSTSYNDSTISGRDTTTSVFGFTSIKYSFSIL